MLIVQSLPVINIQIFIAKNFTLSDNILVSLCFFCVCMMSDC